MQKRTKITGATGCFAEIRNHTFHAHQRLTRTELICRDCGLTIRPKLFTWKTIDISKSIFLYRTHYYPYNGEETRHL